MYALVRLFRQSQMSVAEREGRAVEGDDRRERTKFSVFRGSLAAFLLLFMKRNGCCSRRRESLSLVTPSLLAVVFLLGLGGGSVVITGTLVEAH